MTDFDDVILVRYIDLTDDQLEHLGWSLHPAGRYLATADLHALLDLYRKRGNEPPALDHLLAEIDKQPTTNP